jgi:hypothetical protein
MEPFLDPFHEKGGCKLGHKIAWVVSFLDPGSHDPIGPGARGTGTGPWMVRLAGFPGLG